MYLKPSSFTRGSESDFAVGLALTRHSMVSTTKQAAEVAYTRVARNGRNALLWSRAKRTRGRGRPRACRGIVPFFVV
ncbi:hypothetical protein PAXRUDRAFT_834117, partial [Paxillus rubicundulus Ve08.2h10]